MSKHTEGEGTAAVADAAYNFGSNRPAYLAALRRLAAWWSMGSWDGRSIEAPTVAELMGVEEGYGA